MTRPIVFLGPSLSHAEARTLLDADYRPPAARGDFVRACREEPPLIALIDGVFMHALAPSPHEILRVLEAGILVMGSSSLGALRAVELAPFGMRGVGTIFQWFHSGRLNADDEVALVFSSETLRAMSDPMVNIRFALDAAKGAGVVSERERRILLRAAKSLYFPERSLRRMLHDARGKIGNAAIARLEAFLKRDDYDLKAHDARQLLREAAQLLEPGATREGAMSVGASR